MVGSTMEDENVGRLHVTMEEGWFLGVSFI
jgi:hypothetical protein